MGPKGRVPEGPLTVSEGVFAKGLRGTDEVCKG